MAVDVKYISLYHIDKENEKIIKREISITDAREYVMKLTKKMIENEKMRRYEIKTDPNPVISNVTNIMKQVNSLSLNTEVAVTSDKTAALDKSVEAIAQRLLTAQVISQKKYSFTELKRGSLIQSYVLVDNIPLYLLALIDHSSFIDELDLSRKSGIPDDNKATFKNARIHFNSDYTLSSIYLSDSQTKISTYWYDSFLDMQTTTDNIANTRYAYTLISKVLSNKLCRKHKQDLIEYNNSLKIYFTKNDSFDFDECLDFVFKGEPYSKNLDIAALKSEITNKKNTTKSFDDVFDIDITDIKHALRHRNYKLNPNVELKLKTIDDTIKENVFTTQLPNGELVIAISNVDEEQLKTFNFDNISL